MQARRFKLIGNAVSVPVARWLGQRLANPYQHKYITGARDKKMTQQKPASCGNGIDHRLHDQFHEGLLSFAGGDDVEEGDYYWLKPATVSSLSPCDQAHHHLSPDFCH